MGSHRPSFRLLCSLAVRIPGTAGARSHDILSPDLTHLLSVTGRTGRVSNDTTSGRDGVTHSQCFSAAAFRGHEQCKALLNNPEHVPIQADEWTKARLQGTSKTLRTTCEKLGYLEHLLPSMWTPKASRPEPALHPRLISSGLNRRAPGCDSSWLGQVEVVGLTSFGFVLGKRACQICSLPAGSRKSHRSPYITLHHPGKQSRARTMTALCQKNRRDLAPHSED